MHAAQVGSDSGRQSSGLADRAVSRADIHRLCTDLPQVRSVYCTALNPDARVVSKRLAMSGGSRKSGRGVKFRVVSGLQSRVGMTYGARERSTPSVEPVSVRGNEARLRSRTRSMQGSKGKTISSPRLSRAEVRDGVDLTLSGAYDYERPKTRGDCVDGIRPCPFVSCKYHLYLDVTGDQSIKINRPGVDLADMPETCALDVADAGGDKTLEEVGHLMNLTRERTRQIYNDAVGKLHAAIAAPDRQ